MKYYHPQLGEWIKVKMTAHAQTPSGRLVRLKMPWGEEKIVNSPYLIPDKASPPKSPYPRKPTLVLGGK